MQSPQDLQPHHIQFQTNDSQASDTSYQSSLSSNEDSSSCNAQYFRQEMSRFFINYPELLNQELVINGGNANGANFQKSIWGDLAADVINQAKQEPISLQGIAKRIAFYRQKSQEIDIIDLIVKEKQLILRELDQEAKLTFQENINQKNQEVVDKRNNKLGQTNQNIYYSWKKKQQANLINNSRKTSQRKLKSSSSHSNLQTPPKIQSNPRLNSTSKPKLPLSKNPSTSSAFPSYPPQSTQPIHSSLPFGSTSASHSNSNQFSNPASAQTQNPKPFPKFQPKTQTAKQLLEQIRKHSPSDEIGIKKTIVNFLSRHRENIKKNVLSKSSLNERLSKLHIEDSKELLLFCPLKKNSVENDMPMTTETNNFLQILNEISTGHLMKYWKLLQQKKL